MYSILFLSLWFSSEGSRCQSDSLPEKRHIFRRHPTPASNSTTEVGCLQDRFSGSSHLLSETARLLLAFTPTVAFNPGKLQVLPLASRPKLAPQQLDFYAHILNSQKRRGQVSHMKVKAKDKKKNWKNRKKTKLWSAGQDASASGNVQPKYRKPKKKTSRNPLWEAEEEEERKVGEEEEEENLEKLERARQDPERHVIIVQAVPDQQDVEKAEEMLRRIWPLQEGKFMDAAFRRHQRVGNALFVAKVGQTIVGTLCLDRQILNTESRNLRRFEDMRYDPLEPGKDAVIFVVTSVAVRKDMRGLGLARRLLAAAEDHAQAWDANDLFLEREVGNEAAHSLYKSCGYKDFHEDIDWRSGVEIHRMWKRLSHVPEDGPASNLAVQDFRGQPVLANLTDPDTGRKLPCFVATSMERDGDTYSALYPVNTPISFAEVRGESLDAVDIEGEPPELLAKIERSLRSSGVELLRTPVMLTARGSGLDREHTEEDEENGEVWLRSVTYNLRDIHVMKTLDRLYVMGKKLNGTEGADYIQLMDHEIDDVEKAMTSLIKKFESASGYDHG